MPPGLEPAADEPVLPEGYDETGLPMPIRAELRGLSKGLASTVGGHLRAAGELLEADPELALRHVMVARRLASRLPIVREAAAETAYAAGDFQIALTEYRALHRITGNADFLPVIADCERAVGKQQQALHTLREARGARLSPAQRVELILVESGVRDDLGQRAEALRVLSEAISSKRGGRQGQARLRYAYANLLAAAGRSQGAQEWFTSADSYDDESQLDARARIAELTGLEVVPGSDDEFEVMQVESVDDEPEDTDDADDVEE